MSRISSSLLGVAIVSLLISAVSLEMASSEAFGFSTRIEGQGQELDSHAVVNRSSKSDRTPSSAFAVKGTTLVFQLADMPSTSIVTRSPLRQEPPTLRARARQTVACEGVVSVLTEIAAQLAPGRCVT